MELNVEVDVCMQSHIRTPVLSYYSPYSNVITSIFASASFTGQCLVMYAAVSYIILLLYPCVWKLHGYKMHFNVVHIRPIFSPSLS